MKGVQALIKSYDNIAQIDLEPLVGLSVQHQQRVELQQQRDSEQQQFLQLVCGLRGLRSRKNEWYGDY